MNIYLLRHAHAIDGDDDALRPLSSHGYAQIRQLARFLRRRDLLEAREFWHSPLVRARDTAARLAGQLSTEIKLVERDGLAPFDPIDGIVHRLRTVRRPVVVVGHEPHLSALATRLLVGKGRTPVVELKKCALLALSRRGSAWSLRWLLAPAVLEPRHQH